MTDKQRLWLNISLVAEFYGETLAWTQEYANDVYIAWNEDLPKAIACFEDLLEQTSHVPRRT